ncbi:protein FAM185A [Euwallacea similis]|uniref:protein FAM185A n=1 Tax=Euwallacea similis TaxID=1736056 RepID=UPI00344D9814
MLFIKHLLNPSLILKPDTGLFQLYRKCSDLSIVKTQLEVPTFCDIHVDLACKVRIKPLNVHKYHNSNAFLLQTDQKYDNAIEHYVDGNKVIVKGHENLNPNTLCSMKAPVKANLHIKAQNDVSVGYFQGDKLKIETEKNVFVDRFQGDTIDVSTQNGNIVLHNFIQAANISAKTTNGIIKAGRLQGLNLKLKSLEKGNLTVDSSYCSESIFVVEHGNMELHNIHKNCKIFMMKGNVILTGFDGQLSMVINNGCADIHLSRIMGSSDITIKDSGSLILKLTDSCCDSNMFKIASPRVTLMNTIKDSSIIKEENMVVLNSESISANVVLVNCLNSNVKVETTSWQEMIEMKLKNK